MQVQMYNKLTKYFDICIIATQWLESVTQEEVYRFIIVSINYQYYS